VAIRKYTYRLRLDVRPLDVLTFIERLDLNLVVEVADVANDGLSFIRSMCASVIMSTLPVVLT